MRTGRATEGWPYHQFMDCYRPFVHSLCGRMGRRLLGGLVGWRTFRNFSTRKRARLVSRRGAVVQSVVQSAFLTFGNTLWTRTKKEAPVRDVSHGSRVWAALDSNQ